MSDIISKPLPNREDATGLNKEFGFGYFETYGGRGTQEDALAWHVLSQSDLSSKGASEQLTPTEIGHRLWTSYQILDTPDLQSGTTAATTVYDGKGNFITATLADAASFAVVYDKAGNALGVTRLNSVTHKPSDPDEKARIEAAGGFIMFWGTHRVDGNLAVSRAIGDNNGQLKEHGVCSEATIDITNADKIASDLGITPENVGFIQVINTCDGFTDGSGANTQSKKNHEDYLFNILKNLESPGNMAQDELAKTLSLQALTDGSRDNVSVAVQTITSQTPPVFIGVYDGHGGIEASCKVADNIGRVFKEQCALTLEQYAQQDLSVVTKKAIYERDNKDVDLAPNQLHSKLATPETAQAAKPEAKTEPDPVNKVIGVEEKPQIKPTTTKAAPIKPTTAPEQVRKISLAEETKLLATLNDLRKLTKDYQHSLNSSKTNVEQIKPIINKLVDILESKESSEKVLKQYYSFLDQAHQIKGEPAAKNIDIIKKDKSSSALNFLAGIAIIAATIITGILPGLLVIGIVYAATGRTPLDLLKSNGERFEKETKLIKENSGFSSGFFKQEPSAKQDKTEDLYSNPEDDSSADLDIKPK
jgi:YD repeat-containing protein